MTTWSTYGFAARALLLGAALAAAWVAPIVTESVRAQNDASAPNAECECYLGLGSLPGFGPKNFCHLVDGRRYDISTHRFFRNAMPGVPEQELPASAEPFFDSGMYRILPEVDIVIGPGYGYGSSIFVSPEPFVQGASTGFDTESDFVDEEPPTVGDGLRVTTRIFTNDCGSQALYFEDQGTRDNLTGNVYRLPVVVEIRSLERDLSFTTFSTTYGVTTDGLVENVIGYYPFTGWCVGDRGLESLGFRLGERVEFQLTVFDHACNAAEPVVQTIEWPIEPASVGTGGSGGSGASGGSGGSGASGGASGAGASGGSPASNGGGCDVHEVNAGNGLGLLWLLALVAIGARFRARESTSPLTKR